MKPVNSIPVLAGAVLALVSTVILLHILRFDTTSYLSRAFLDSLHLPGFAAVSLVSAVVAHRYRYMPIERAILLVVVACSALGFVSEASQFFTARDADPWDLAADLAGIAAGITIFLALRRKQVAESRPHLQTALAALGVAAVIATLWPSAWIANNMLARWQSLPVLVSFDDNWEDAIHKSAPENALTLVPAPSDWPAPGQVIGMLSAPGPGYPGMIFDPYPDWQQYDAFSFVAASASGRDETFTLRIHDSSYLPGHYHRFDREYVATSTPSRIRVDFSEFIPESGDAIVDISAITEVRLRLLNRQSSSLLVDDFRLERN